MECCILLSCAWEEVLVHSQEHCVSNSRRKSSSLSQPHQHGLLWNLIDYSWPQLFNRLQGHWLLLHIFHRKTSVQSLDEEADLVLTTSKAAPDYGCLARLTTLCSYTAFMVFSTCFRNTCGIRPHRVFTVSKNLVWSGKKRDWKRFSSKGYWKKEPQQQ